ncbi:MAG: dTDP-4-dehydrorhamnose reductase [Chitinophagaceae bacterium]
MNKPIVLVTGANGQVGKELQACSPGYSAFEVIFVSKEDLPIDQFDQVENFFRSVKPQYCINCAAYTAVDKAEIETDLAFRINGESPGALASACNLSGTKFIHISTDYVFNGTSGIPYSELDAVDPVNAYGASKLHGEVLALKYNPNSIVIRTSWVYSSFGNNFVKTMMRLMKERENINVVSDQHGSPTYAADLALLFLHIIGSGHWVPGIYHYSNEGIISWYDFAVAIKELSASNCIVHPIPTSSYPTPAKRPVYSAFDKGKIKSVFDIPIPDWKESLQKCVEKLLI